MIARIVIHVESGPFAGRRFEFEGPRVVTVGRQKDCDICIVDDLRLSRYHFRLSIEPSGVRLQDLNSSLGTKINGVTIGGLGGSEKSLPLAVELAHGAEIVAAETTMRLSLQHEARCAACGAKMTVESPDGSAPARCDACRPPRPANADHQFARTIAWMPAEAPVELPMSGPPLFARPAMPTPRSASGKNAQNESDVIAWTREALALAEDQPLRIGDYSLGPILGKGGMGVVFRAFREGVDTPVAIKILLAKVAVDAQMSELFHREISVLSRLDHPNIVRLHDSGAEGRLFYFVMEHCDSGSLSELARRHGGKVPMDIALPVMRDCLAGLAYAHSHRIVHRDLSPRNILMQRVQGRDVARISDFGLARKFDESGLSQFSLAGRHAGTPEFMAREQLLEYSNPRPASDVWSLAATFYRLLTGRLPREFTDDRDTIDVIRNDESLPIRLRLPKLPEAIAGVIDRALDNDLGRRYRDGEEFQSSLNQALSA